MTQAVIRVAPSLPTHIMRPMPYTEGLQPHSDSAAETSALDMGVIPFEIWGLIA